MQNITIESDTSGIWKIYVAKFALAVLMIIPIVMLVGMLTSFTEVSLSTFWGITGSIYVLVNWITYKRLPLKYNNGVSIDFQNKTLNIFNKRSNATNMNVLDFEGRRINFDEIDHYSTKNYESLLFSSYYLVSIFANGSNLKLLCLKDGRVLSEVVSLLANEIGLAVK